jgi:hypothetical protein
LPPAQRMKPPLRTAPTGTLNVLATSASMALGTGTGARGAAPEAQMGEALAAVAGAAKDSAPNARAARIAHAPSLTRADISVSLGVREGETALMRRLRQSAKV